MSRLTGAKVVVRCLKKQGMGTVFGFPGGVIPNIYDALYQHQDEIIRILASHGRGASHVADGYARVTGKVGVCTAIPDPGAANLVTGIAMVYTDSAPMMAITCDVTNSLLGKDSLQEIDITGVIMPITEYNFIVKDVKRSATAIRRTFTVAQTGCPGPVLVNITEDVTAAACEYEKEVPKEIVRQNDTIREKGVERVMEMICKSRKSFIFANSGAVLSSASDELRAFAHKIQASVTDSLMDKGALDGCDELYISMASMHGTETSNFDMAEANLLIVVGAKLSDRVIDSTFKFTKNAKILQLDIDLVEVNKNTRVDASVIGGVKVILHKLNVRLDPINHDEQTAHTERMKDMYLLHYDKNTLTGPFTTRTINEVTQGDTVIVTEVGQHQIWAAQYCNHHQPRTSLTSGDLGAMGHGLGAAIGARMECRDKTVINVVGDGCFRMNMDEVAAAIRYSIPMVEVIANNHVLSMVRQWRTPFYGKCYSQTILNDGVDFIKVVEATRAKTHRVTQKEELGPTLREAIPLGVPVVIDCQISCDEKVLPMVSPGVSVADAFDDTDLKVN